MRTFLKTLIFLFPCLVLGQISVSTTATLSENFDGMGATTTLPTNWKMHASTSSPTWAGGATSVTQQASSGSPTTGGTYNWGTSAGERAVGAMTSAGFASPNNLMVFYRNTHASDNITSLTIAYDAERYRINSASASISFFYSLDGSSWNAVAAGDIAAASFATGASSYTFATPTTVNKTGITISGLTITPNSNFYLRWNINTTGSNSQGIGIDNISMTPTFTAVTPTPELNLQQPAGTDRACGYTHSFGSVLTTSSGTVALTIQNTGTAAIDITALNMSGSSDYSLSSPPALPFSIAAGSSQTININFNPTSAGTITGALTIASNDADEGSCIFNLSGTGVIPGPELNLQQPIGTDRACGYSYSYGSIAVGSSSSTVFRIQNTGTATMNITALNLVGSGYALVSPPALPTTIAAGANLDITISTTPASSGTINGSLTISSDDSDEGSCQINLTTIGVTTCNDLFFSEYVMGSSNNKYVEIYNASSSNINLANYQVRVYSNGSGTSTNITLSGTLAPFGTYVLAHSSATVWGGTPNQLSGSLGFNGDDALELYNNSLGYTADIIGRIGEDPGTGWSSGGNSTLSKTLVRNSTVQIGVMTNPGSGFPTLGTEWTVYNVDDVSHLGTHTSTCMNLTVTSVSTSPFATTCVSGASGSLNFTSTGIFTSGNVFTAQLSSSTGSFTSPVAIGTLSGASAEGTNPSGTLNFTIPAGTASGTAYRIRLIASNPSTSGTDNGTDLTVNFTNDCSLATTSVTGGPFTVNCNTPATGTIDYSFTGTLTSGNIFTVQLSNSTGSFATPTSIGTLNSTATSGSINISIPSTVTDGTAYRIRVISSAPATTGTDNGSDITITKIACPPATLPQSEGLLINEFSNGTTGEREYYEFVVAGRCGDIVDIRGYIIDDNNGTFSSSFPLSGTGIADGHLRLKNHSQWAAIPVGSLIVVYNASDFAPSVIPADDPFDGDGDSLYVIPHDNSTLLEIAVNVPSNSIPDSTYSAAVYGSSSWGALSLANSGDAVQVRAPDGSYFHGVSYGGADITGGPNDMKIYNLSMSTMCGWFNDGDVLNPSNWSVGAASSNQTPGLPNNAANLAWLREMRDPMSEVCPITMLPSELVTFNGTYLSNFVELYWTTESEINNDYFTLMHSTDGKNFTTIGVVSGSGTTPQMNSYRYVHPHPIAGINYYKLFSTDYDGKMYDKGIVAIEADFNFTYYNEVTQTIELSNEANVDILSMDGKLIKSSEKTKSIPFDRSGVFLIVNKDSGLTERIFIPEIK